MGAEVGSPVGSKGVLVGSAVGSFVGVLDGSREGIVVGAQDTAIEIILFLEKIFDLASFKIFWYFFILFDLFLQ